MKKYWWASAVVMAVSATPGWAYEAGDLVVRAGVASVQPAGDGGLQGALDVKNNSQLGLTLSYWLSPQLSLGLLAATPFKHDITLNGATVASTEHLPPTLTLQYQIPGLGQWHPYVGAGINYTAFFGEESRLGTLQLEDSLGLAGELGVDYALNAHWGLNAAMWYLDIDTEAQLNGKPLSDVAIDPWVYQLAVSYRF